MRKILTAVIALTVSMSAFAQSSFSIGIGETLRHRVGTDIMASNTLTQAQSGLMVEATYGYGFTDNIALTAGLRYSFEGIYNKQVIDLSILGIKSQSKWLNGYLELPVNVKFYITPDSACNFFVALGPTLSYWTTNTVKTYAGAGIESTGSASYTANMFDTKLYNRFNVGAGLTLGMDIISHIRVTLGYDFFFLNANNKETSSYNLKNGQGRLGVAYIF